VINNILQGSAAESDSEKKIKISEYLAKLQARMWLSAFSMKHPNTLPTQTDIRNN